jgi:hypothetical protein
MVLYRETYRDLACLLGISEQSFSSKINEKGSEFKQGEIAKICEHYDLSAEQMKSIFFAE